MSNIYVKTVVGETGFMPVKAHTQDAGFDLYTPVDFDLSCGEEFFVDLDLKMLIPAGYVGMIKSKSGYNREYGLTVEGVVDAGYVGNIGAQMRRSTNPKNDCKIHFDRGDKVAQIVIMPIPYVQLELVDRLEETERGEGGFGSTGVK